MLLLLPNLIGNQREHSSFLPESVDNAVKNMDGLIAESFKGGRGYLRRFVDEPHNVPLALLNEHTKDDEFDFLLEPMVNGETWGLVSDAGLPCLADPGANLIYRARQRGIPIQAFVGPSSLMLGVMLSGLPSQRFSFHGYIPRDKQERVDAIRKMERRSKEEDATQLFIEAPYRNDDVTKALLETLHPKTMLCAAVDLTLSSQMVVCFSVDVWKKRPLPNLNKKPTIFLIYAGDPFPQGNQVNQMNTKKRRAR